MTYRTTQRVAYVLAWAALPLLCVAFLFGIIATVVHGLMERE
jgi:hypothetical protein